MLRTLLIVSAGSFVGGGMRWLISKALESCVSLTFPLGTFAVNIIGCLLIGIFSGVYESSNMMSYNMKLFLTTGLCGGFTTFSTFMNESHILLKEDHALYMALYLLFSLTLGFIAVWAGYALAKHLSF